MNIESVQIIESRIFQIILLGLITIIICRYLYLIFSKYLDKKTFIENKVEDLISASSDGIKELTEIRGTIVKLSEVIERLTNKLPLFLIFLLISCEPDRIVTYKARDLKNDKRLKKKIKYKQ